MVVCPDNEGDWRIEKEKIEKIIFHNNRTRKRKNFDINVSNND